MTTRARSTSLSPERHSTDAPRERGPGAAAECPGRWTPRVVEGPPASGPAVETPGGVTARIVEGDVLEVRDAGGRLVFEHRPDGRTVVHVAADLEIRAAGTLALVGGQGVRIQGGESVEVQGRDRIRLATAHLDVAARTVATAAEVIRQAADVIETRAGRVVERARSAYREIEDLAQTHAGRVRVVARAAFHLLGERAVLKAREDLKLKGGKIYLG